jgi:hypothetical protein
MDTNMLGSWWNKAGVMLAPTATPKIVLAPTEITPNPLRGRPINAAKRHANIGPNRNGSGR